MKRLNSIGLLIAMLLLAGIPATVKSQAFEEGKSYVSVGYGIGTFFGILKAAIEDGGATDVRLRNFGPIYAKYEYAITDKIGIGVNVASVRNNFIYKASYFDDNGILRTYTYEQTRTNTSLLARINFHIGESDKIDPYVGFGFGYRIGGWKVSSDDPLANQNANTPMFNLLGFETTIGMRLFITDYIGAYSEVGIAKSVFQIGLCARF